MSNLYENRDGLVIEVKLGWTGCYFKVLSKAMEDHGLCGNPDLDELAGIVDKLDNFVHRPAFEEKIGSPIYATADHHARLKEIVRSMKASRPPSLSDREEVKRQLDGFPERTKEADEQYGSDPLSS